MISKKAMLLIAFNVLGIGLGYVITIVLARHLNTEQFARYIGVIATLLVLASIGEAGFGKYALKVLPVYSESSPAMMKGYLRFSMLGTLSLTATLGFSALLIELPSHRDAAWNSIILALFFLPVMAGLGVALDLLCGLKRAVLAGLLSRVVVPLTTLVLMFVVLRYYETSPFAAVVCFCTGSLVGFVIATFLVWRLTIPHVRSTAQATDYRLWIGQGVVYMGAGFLVSWMFRATIVVADHVSTTASEMALLAPAFETGSLVVLLSKSTDKYFQPKLSLIIEQRDWDHGQHFRMSRYLTIGIGVAIFLAITGIFGKQILSLFGPTYVRAYVPMCLFAIGSSVWSLFSLAPSFLIFTERKNVLIANLLLHGLALGASVAVLFPTYGALGASACYAICITSLALSNLWLAMRRVRELIAEEKPDPSSDPVGFPV